LRCTITTEKKPWLSVSKSWRLIWLCKFKKLFMQTSSLFLFWVNAFQAINFAKFAIWCRTYCTNFFSCFSNFNAESLKYKLQCSIVDFSHHYKHHWLCGCVKSLLLKTLIRKSCVFAHRQGWTKPFDLNTCWFIEKSFHLIILCNNFWLNV
jgi:hypothetical protein